MSKPPRRLTRAEADALVADIDPAERAAILAGFVARLRAAGVPCAVVRDATGRTYLELDLDAVRAIATPAARELAALLEEGAATSPQPIWEQPRKARTI